MLMLCVKDILLKMFLYVHGSEIQNFAWAYMEQNCLAFRLFLFVCLRFVFLPCSPGESIFAISKETKTILQK